MADDCDLSALLESALAVANADLPADNSALESEILQHRAILSRLQAEIECASTQQQATAASFGVEGVDYDHGDVDDLNPAEWKVPEFCVPIHADVRTFNWRLLYERTQFDVIMMDPPWQLATSNPSRGVALGYTQLLDRQILELPVPKLQKDGLLFIWVINAKYQLCVDLFRHWGYRLMDEIVWVKMTVNRRLAKSHGFYLQHAKEVCLVGQKGAGLSGLNGGISSDVIFSERRGQSQKPEEIYHLIEELVPNGTWQSAHKNSFQPARWAWAPQALYALRDKVRGLTAGRYLEIFARKNNLRNWWVSIGNEVTGTGLPREDGTTSGGVLAICAEPTSTQGAAPHEERPDR